MSNIDHVTAHTELPDHLLPHYLLGRQLALELVLRELVTQLPPGRREKLQERMRYESDCALQRASSAGAEMGVLHASDCGLACGLIQMGF
jgi:hypothetical protein